MGTTLRYYIATSALAYLLSSTYGSEEQSTSTLPPTTTVDIQLKTEEVQLVTSDLISLNSSNYRPFQCEVKGLTEETLERLKSREDTVIVTVNGDEYASSFDNQSAEDVGVINGTQAINVHFHIENDTVFINGTLRENGSNFDINADNNSTNTCKLSFHKEEVQVSGDSPKILTTYDHVVLMNGAPDQVISCTATGKPTPRMSWGNLKQNLEGSIALSSESIYSQPENARTSYLLFSEVNLKTSDNYTCTAENEFGVASKTFEVEVISVESLNSRCNDVLDEAGNTPSSSQNNGAIIFNQDIGKVLSRSKRHLWYQWRGTKYYVPPVRRPQPPPAPSHVDIHTNLQKMVNFITERLKLADKVAVNKWDNNLPVEDVPREQIILDNMVRQAENGNVDPRWAHQFFRDQIEANKDIQFELIRIWQLQGRRPDGPPVDLTNEVRPQIDIINAELIQLAKKTEYERREWKCRSEVERNARYATFLYDLDPLHQTALQKATSRLCITSRHPPSYPY
ncbi:unnamed protein product [Orchesella dallaii]|uniref:chorismate mutase n=1 Tax=Orchesella dallaii TaxID=48710 RepID=A0ABP1Q9C6_9HEXA